MQQLVQLSHAIIMTCPSLWKSGLCRRAIRDSEERLLALSFARTGCGEGEHTLSDLTGHDAFGD